jgi:hypothetical protein
MSTEVEAVGALAILSSVVFGLVAKDKNPWFVVWVFLSALVAVVVGLTRAR